MPEKRRGRYFGIRNTLLSLTTMIFTFATGKFLDAYKTDYGFAYVCSLAVLAGIMAMVLLQLQPEPMTLRPTSESGLETLQTIIRAPLQDRRFRRLIVFLGVWSLIAPLASPFYIVHLLKNLSAESCSLVGTYIAISAASGITFQWLWGRAIDRFGAKPIMFINLFLTGFLPLLWIFATPKFLLTVWLDGVGNGLFWSGATLAWFSMLLGFAQGKPHRDAYFAFFTAVTGLGGFVAALMGGALAQALNGFRLHLGPFRFVNFHIMLLLAGVGRFASLSVLRKVPEERAAGIKEVLEGIGDYTLRSLNYGRELIVDSISFISRRIFAGAGGES